MDCKVVRFQDLRCDKEECSLSKGLHHQAHSSVCSKLFPKEICIIKIDKITTSNYEVCPEGAPLHTVKLTAMDRNRV
jgi:uncharacterized protein (UPF0179 family)